MEIYIDELTKEEAPDELEEKFEFVKSIASGSFGTVIQAVEKSTNREVAVKVINKSGARPSLISKMKEEISILKQLKHENIVHFFGYIETNSKLYIIMELIKSGTLSHWIKAHIENITEVEASVIIGRLLSAVEYLHIKQICHRDIKPENIMLNNFNDLTSLKLIDFGLSAQHFDSLENSDYCGTLLYMAPEQIEKKLYSKTVDIWSIGVIMFMLLNQGKHPFYIKGDKKQGYVQKLKNAKVTLFNKCSPMAELLLRKLLEPNPSWRYTADRAIKHPWITRKVDDDVPLTMNDVLSRRNYRKCGKEIVLLSVFLNYCKKKEKIKNRNLNKCENIFRRHNKKKKTTFYISDDYIQQVNFYSKQKREKLKKRKERCLEILISREEENSSKESAKPKKRSSESLIYSFKSSKKDIPKQNKQPYMYNNKQQKVVLQPKKHSTLTLQTEKNVVTPNQNIKVPGTQRNENKTKTVEPSSRKIGKNVEASSSKLRLSRNIGITQPSVKVFNSHHLKNSVSGMNSRKPESTKHLIPHQVKPETFSSHQDNNIILKFSPIKKKDETLPNVKTISPHDKYNNIVHKKVISEVDNDNFSIIPLILPNINLRGKKRKCKVGKF